MDRFTLEPIGHVVGGREVVGEEFHLSGVERCGRGEDAVPEVLVERPPAGVEVACAIEGTREAAEVRERGEHDALGTSVALRVAEGAFASRDRDVHRRSAEERGHRERGRRRRRLVGRVHRLRVAERLTRRVLGLRIEKYGIDYKMFRRSYAAKRLAAE